MITQKFYKGAGVFLYCDDHPAGTSAHVLLLSETRIDKFTNEIQENAYIDLGGKRDYSDINSAYTAARELDEETKFEMYHDMIDVIYTTMYNEQQKNAYMNKNGAYVLFLCKVPYRPIPNTITAEWVPLSNILAVNKESPKINGRPVAYRLIDFLFMPTFRIQLMGLVASRFIG